MKRSLILSLALSALICTATAAAQTAITALLDRSYDFTAAPQRTPQYFSMESRLTSFSQDGELLGTDTYSLLLMYDPQISHVGDGYRCARFQVTFGDTVTREIPALKNWVHVLNPAGIDTAGNVFGIEQAIFDTLTDADGNAIPIDKRYHIYNAFIDFHAMCTVFPQPSEEKGGVQDLHRIGDQVEHYSSYSKPPTHLGSSIRKGSYFQNGRIMLTFKGLSVVDGIPCALIGYDSGESRFKMILEPFPGIEVTAGGRSRYRGNIYRNLENNWVQQVDMQETVIANTTVPGASKKMYSVAERNIFIHNISKEAYSSR